MQESGQPASAPFTMKSKAARQLDEGLLVSLLRAAPCSTCDLASKLEISKPSLSRLIKILRDRGYSIRTVRGQGGWMYVMVGGKSENP